MHDRGKIITGLVIFFILMTFPIWYGLAFAGESSPPELELPENASECIEDTQWIRDNHMNLLNDWRDRVVREAETVYTSTSGEEFTMSLTGTCMNCHTSNDGFCIRCHEFVNVEPTCWNCHVEPREN